MGKAQKKTGKGRLDKYYKLAKEQGYRARSAFKLIQLNKKFAFLESARCCIDLCAAPGGWLQVASKFMAVNSIIVGVDLVPIKPIPRVATFVADITTPQCRNLIRGELKDWKADVVLHDGAPNVGTAWVQDAYGQSELVLMSLKLAVEFLIQGGTFVTKVFRSADYNNLIWVFKQLFSKVEATKPPSSRNVSAEIFVVCRDFLAPKVIDPKFLDPKHVFKDLAPSAPSGADKGISANNSHANVFQPEKKRRKRDGYDDGDYTLFKKISAEEFVKGSEPVSVLGRINKITFENQEEMKWLDLDITTLDVKNNCDDLKVLGKGDFKALLKWRTAIREELGLDLKTKNVEELTEAVEIVEEVDEEAEIQNELERLNAEAAARTKRERRRANEIKTKTIQRMQLQMTAPLDIGLEQTDPSLHFGQDDFFNLEHTENALNHCELQFANDDLDSVDSDDDVLDEDADEDADEDDVPDEKEDSEKRTTALELELDGLYDAYRERLRERDAKYKVRESRQKNAAREEWQGILKDETEYSGSDDGGWNGTQGGDGEASSSSESDEDHVVVGQKRSCSTKPKSSPKRRLLTKLEEKQHSSSAAQIWFSQDIFTGMEGLNGKSDDDVDETMQVTDDTVDARENDEAMTEDDFEIVAQDVDEDTAMWNVQDGNGDEEKQANIQKHGLLTPEAVTLALQLVNREKTKTQLINDGFNRYSLNSKEGLPSWFLDDEAKAYKPNIPITKEAVAILRAKQRALDARPIKKIAEAKARKKYKAAQRLDKAIKKAEGVNSTNDMTEREKAQQIEKLMRKGMSKGKREKKEVKVIVAKGVHKGLKGRPKGVKGRYAMVDARMRKEVRAKKRREKATKKRKRS